MRFKFHIIAWLLGMFCLAQTDSTRVSFVAYWSKGDSYDFLVSKIKRQWDGETLKKQDSISNFATFTVIDSTENSYKINWKYKINLENFPIQYTDLLNNNSVELDIIYTTNELGEFGEIENWQTVSEYIKAVFGIVRNKIKDKFSISELEKYDKATEPLLSIFTSKEGVESLVLKEISYFHFPLGYEFDPKEILEFEDILPNLVSDEDLKGDAKIYFHEVDYENEFCSFSHEMALNVEDTKKLLSYLMLKMGIPITELEQFLNQEKFKIQDNNYFEFFYFPGVPYFIETNRTIEAETIKEEEITRIELILE